jgi:L-malate glycosyltransferase
VHVINSLRRGGTEGQAVQLVRLLRESGRFDVTLACLDADGPLRNELGAAASDVLHFPLTSLHEWNTTRQFARFASYLREREVSVVHTHDIYSNIFGLPAARIAGVPVRIASRRDMGGVGTNGRRRVEGTLFRLADKVVTNAEAVGQHLIGQGVTAAKIVTIHNAVDPERVRPQLSRHDALELFGLPSDRRFVVMVANLRHDVKDHPTFLRAARRVGDVVSASAFVVAGHGPLSPQIVRLANSLGIHDNVFFVGHCTAIGDLLGLAEVCVLCSKSEGLSNAILEYMAAGRPVVATDVGGSREAVVHGQTGYLVAAADDQELAERVVALLDDPAKARAMGERGRQRASDCFSCALLVQRTIRLYESILQAKTDGALSP